MKSVSRQAVLKKKKKKKIFTIKVYHEVKPFSMILEILLKNYVIDQDLSDLWDMTWVRYLLAVGRIEVEVLYGNTCPAAPGIPGNP